jgi:hypothetical protein
LQVFANTKADEIIEIYKAAGSREKMAVIRAMGMVDPSRASNYRQGIGK